MLFVINVSYGVSVGIGLALIGLPNAVLWGILATVLRFIPYVGPWIAAAMPIALSMAVGTGWATPLLTIGMFVVLELFSNNVLEPWLYGSSTGVSRRSDSSLFPFDVLKHDHGCRRGRVQ